MFHTKRQTDKHGEANSHFLQFAKEPKNFSSGLKFVMREE